MNAPSAHDPPRTLAKPVQHEATAPTPEPLRPATGLILGLLLSSVLWLVLLVAWLAF